MSKVQRHNPLSGYTSPESTMEKPEEDSGNHYDVVDRCPFCNTKMTKVTAMGHNVYLCKTHRVVMPTQDAGS